MNHYLLAANDGCKIVNIRIAGLYHIKIELGANCNQSIYMHIRNLVLACIFLLMSLLSACKSGFEHNSKGMEQLNSELQKEFGKDAWYTGIDLISKSGSDDIIIIDYTTNPNSLKQEQWMQYHGFWEKKADISLSVEGASPVSFMFQLDKEVSLTKLGQLMEKSVQTIEKEKGSGKYSISMARIKSENLMDARQSGIYYAITVQEETSDKRYSFIYNTDGSIRKRLE